MGKKKHIQLLARNFMRKIAHGYTINLHQIAQQLNTQICYRNDMPRNVNGVTIPLQDGSYIIAIKSPQPFLSERFSIAREIAHIVLGHCAEGIVITSSSEMHNPGIFPCDWESFAFALEMLVPLEELRYSLSAYEVLDIDRLCTLYGVAGEIIKTRLNEIGLIQSSHALPHTLSLVNCGAYGTAH